MRLREDGCIYTFQCVVRIHLEGKQFSLSEKLLGSILTLRSDFTWMHEIRCKWSEENCRGITF